MHAQGGMFAKLNVYFIIPSLHIFLFFFGVVAHQPLSSDSVVAMTIAPRSTGHLTEDTARDTDAWEIRAEIETVTETGSHMEQLKVTIHATSPQTCATTDVAERGSASGTSRTGGKAAGVSTNEGGVEPGPIAHPPR